ncbi:MAG: thiamine pyrophosphate-dependent dehydrogenase E1 component subunit alpha [Candidatus Schekmanbacteria bacterium]|nr:thiamine pyrophosphate-dependent dehydrogenase E1 component subunit alpha [Candidatus Schekmanbacteria bacterium]
MPVCAEPEIPVSIQIELLRLMLLMRRFEEKIIEVYPAQDMKTPVHLYIGEEAIAAGVCVHLRRDDVIFSTHRSHGHCLAKGMSPQALLAEFYGRVTGCCKGKGGSMHPVDPDNGILGTSAIVGGGIALAVGAALAAKMKKTDSLAVTFFGDGATDEGIFHESLNFASLKKLPVIFVCENNFYATNSPQRARQPHDNIAKRAAGYAIPGFQIDGNDVLGIYNLAKIACRRARYGLGPTLVECRTYRWKGHVGPDCDYEKGCRPKDELEDWMEKCPVKAYSEYLIANDLVDAAEIKKLTSLIDRELDEALKSAQAGAYPELADLYRDVYYESTAVN